MEQIPLTEQKKYHIWALGCQMNKSDAQRLATKLESLGYQEALSQEEAHIIAVVACSVRQSAMDRIFGKAKTWNAWKQQRPLVTALTGCVLPNDRPKMRPAFDIFFDINDLEQLGEKIVQKEHALENINPRSDYFRIRPKHSSTFQAFVPIMTGCNQYCTYCAVPFTRGKEISRTGEDVLAEVKTLIAGGMKEITFLGQTIDAYRNPDASSLIRTLGDLLRACADLPGDFWLRFLTSHPNYFSEDLIDAIASSSKITPYIHLPIQAGDNEMLRRMNRKYTREHYLSIIELIRSRLPHASISTDIIVGFPGETEAQFLQTADVFERVRYDMAYIAQYSPRPGTASQKVWKDDVPRQEKKRREDHLNMILTKHLEVHHRHLVGAKEKILAEQVAADRVTGHTATYKKVVVHGTPNVHQGDWLNVTITSSEAFGLRGKLNEPPKKQEGLQKIKPVTELVRIAGQRP